MTGRIEMLFTEIENGVTNMECNIEIHHFTKADICKVVSTLLEHLDVTTTDWKAWEISQMVDRFLSDHDEMKKNGFDFEEWLKNENESNN